MRYRPEAVSAAILSVAGETGASEGHGSRCRSSTRRPTSATTSRSRRSWACRSRPTRSPSGPSGSARALEADGGFAIVGADRARRGTRSPPSTIRASCASSRSPGPSSGAQELDRPFLSADTYPNRAMFEGMTRRGRRARSSASRSTPAGGPASGASTRRRRWWPARTSPRAAAVDVALTTVDLVLGGAPAAYGLCRPPGHHAARSMYGGYCFFNNAAIAAEAIVRGDRRAGRDPRRRLPPRQRHASRSSGGAATSATSRSTPTRTAHYPYFLGRADETGEGDGAGENLNIPLRAGRDQRGLPRRRRPGARGDRGRARLDRRRLARLRHLRPRPDRRLRADDRRLPRDRPADGRARPAAGHPPGGRLPPAVARRERPGVAARRGGPAVRSAAGRRASASVARSPGSVGDGHRRPAADAGRPACRGRRARARATRTSPAIVARYGPPPLWDREPGLRDARSTSSSSSRSRSPRPRPPSTGSALAADPLTPARFLELTDAELLAIGFSRQKARYGRALASAIEIGRARPRRARRASTTTRSTARSRRCPGIGPWTSTIYLLMVLGRPDVWPVGDIALAAVGRPRSRASATGRTPTRWRRSVRRGGRGGRSPRGSSGTTTWRVAAGPARPPARPSRSRRRPTYHRGLHRSDRLVQPARPAQPRPAHRRRDRERDRRGPTRPAATSSRATARGSHGAERPGRGRRPRDPARDRRGPRPRRAWPGRRSASTGCTRS